MTRSNGRCWNQDQIDWAYAGNAAEAKKGLIRRFLYASPMTRFPIYGDSPPDEVPDFDHFGSGATALQRMLVQVTCPTRPFMRRRYTKGKMVCGVWLPEKDYHSLMESYRNRWGEQVLDFQLLPKLGRLKYLSRLRGLALIF